MHYGRTQTEKLINSMHFCRNFIHIFFILCLCSPAQGEIYKEEKDSGAGTLYGKIHFEGKVPQPKIFSIEKDKEICGKKERTIQEVPVTKGALTNAIVYFPDIQKGKPFPSTDEKKTILQDKCFFKPHLLTVKQKSRISIISRDTVGHNIHAYEVHGTRRSTIFNLAQPTPDVKLEARVRVRRSQFVKVECDLHKFMHSWIFVAKNPYYTAVQEDGTFNIDGIPPGIHRIRVWNPLLGEKEKQVTVLPNGKEHLIFRFKE